MQDNNKTWAYAVNHGVTTRHLFNCNIFKLKKQAIDYISTLDNKFAYELIRLKSDGVAMGYAYPDKTISRRIV